MNASVCTISFLVYLLVACRQSTDLSELVLCRHFSELTDNFQKFSGGILGSLLDNITLSANGESWASFFPVYIPLISFSCFIAPASAASNLTEKE